MKLKLILISGISILVLLALFCSKPNDQDDDDDDNNNTALPWELLPSDGQVTGWNKAVGQRYKIPMPDSLYDLINGGAGYYIGFGFTQGAILSYGKDADTVQVFLYEFANSDSATKIFNDDAAGGSSAITTNAENARWEEALFNGNIEAVKTKYYFGVSRLAKDQAAKDLGVSFVNAIVQNITH